MPRYIVLSSILLVVGLLMALVGLVIPAMALFSAPVALYWVRGAQGRSLGLVLLAFCITFLAGMAIALPLAMWLLVAMAAALGIPMALVMQQRLHFGVAVLLLAILGSLWAFSIMLMDWQASQESAEIFFSARVAQMEEAGQGNVEGMEQNAAEMFRWLGEHWNYLVFGTVFGLMYMATAVTLAILRIPVLDQVRMRGSLKDCRPPETLVVGAILLALLWMVDQWWWHTVPLRMIVWNGAMALMFVYLFNGFTILLYALHIFAAPPIVYAMIVVTVLLLGSTLGLHPIFLGFGFFDTWFNFRKRFRILAHIQRIQKRSNNNNSSNEE